MASPAVSAHPGPPSPPRSRRVTDTEPSASSEMPIPSRPFLHKWTVTLNASLCDRRRVFSSSKERSSKSNPTSPVRRPSHTASLGSSASLPVTSSPVSPCAALLSAPSETGITVEGSSKSSSNSSSHLLLSRALRGSSPSATGTFFLIAFVDGCASRGGVPADVAVVSNGLNVSNGSQSDARVGISPKLTMASKWRSCKSSKVFFCSSTQL
mmetsp:Transcript_34299/g.70132  ORF Transcript_34299/g.70132 Transcript_34299/m.70132 type:complete len:211 (-) Transcript_34299:117-749(-)